MLIFIENYCLFQIFELKKSIATLIIAMIEENPRKIEEMGGISKTIGVATVRLGGHRSGSLVGQGKCC